MQGSTRVKSAVHLQVWQSFVKRAPLARPVRYRKGHLHVASGEQLESRALFCGHFGHTNPAPIICQRQRKLQRWARARVHLDFYNRGGFSREIASGVNKTSAARCSGKLQRAPFPDLLEFFCQDLAAYLLKRGPQFIRWCMGSAVKRIVREGKERSYDQSAYK